MASIESTRDINDIDYWTNFYLNFASSNKEYICSLIYQKFGFNARIQKIIDEEYAIFINEVKKPLRSLIDAKIIEHQDYIDIITNYNTNIISVISERYEEQESKEASDFRELLLVEETGNGISFHVSNNVVRELFPNINKPDKKNKKKLSIEFTIADLKRECEKTQCTICMLEYTKDDILTMKKCFHSFHTKCIEKWESQNNKCPICRQ